MDISRGCGVTDDRRPSYHLACLVNGDRSRCRQIAKRTRYQPDFRRRLVEPPSGDGIEGQELIVIGNAINRDIGEVVKPDRRKHGEGE
jgi:hypothetical protein